MSKNIKAPSSLPGYPMLSEEEGLLLSRTAELIGRADGATVCSGCFYNLGEQYLLRAYMKMVGLTEGVHYVFFGGYDYAERAMLFCFPSYLSDAIAAALESSETKSYAAQMKEDAMLSEEALLGIRIQGSGYKTLSHRDYLGALLSLGIERHTLGDIVIPDTHSAYLIAKTNICDFLLTTLEHVGADKVRVSRVPSEEMRALPDMHRFEMISDTIASPRLDSIVAACANLSRKKAKVAVLAGSVELDFRTVTAPDANVPDHSYISIRGVGRFLFLGIDGTSKKGRLRMKAKRFI